MITDQTKQEMWEEIKRSLESNIRTPIRSDERTKEQLKEMFGVGNGQIDNFIGRLLKEGKITKRLALHNGKPCTAYSISSEYMDSDTKDKST